ncbi:MAG: acyl-CoA dehydrogenase family protein [Chloroflexi bacterium]|nr:acyl-CoA dehydrogenase family protein [Chloroflexota bacterium]
MTTADAGNSTPGRSPYQKAERYQTDRFLGAVGLNWFECDLSLQRTLRYYSTQEEYDWAEPHLARIGALMGGPIAERAEETDKNPPRLVKYDRWGNDISRVELPESVVLSKRDYFANRLANKTTREEAERLGVGTEAAGMVQSYLLCQADIGLSCVVGTGTAMIRELVTRFAPKDIQDLVLGKFESGEWQGETAQMFTERAGGSDLGAMECWATPDGDAWRLNGFKWFASNANGQVFVVLGKPEGAPDTVKGVCSFLVMRQRRDGSPNGVYIRQLKDKLGTRTVASAEVEFIDAEAFLLSGVPDEGSAGKVGGDGKGLTRMMEMTNSARLGVALMGLGCARRALAESLCYARVRPAFGKVLIDHPLMKRKLAEMIVDVEATQAMVFDSSGLATQHQAGREPNRLRMTTGLAKLKASRLGITMASDAIEVHGGNGYVESWPVARILRDAQVNTLWEGADNILCLDVRRAIEREEADEPFLERISQAVQHAGEQPAVSIVAERLDDLKAAIDGWKQLDRETGEPRLFELAQFMSEVYAGALLAEQAHWEQREYGDDRKSIIATLYARRYLGEQSPTRGIDAAEDLALTNFDKLVDGAFVDQRAR